MMGGWRQNGWALAIVVGLFLTGAMGLSGCRKIPIQRQSGAFDLGVVHWFETEGVAYFFYALGEDEALFVDPRWELSWSVVTASGGDQEMVEERLDLSRGVHEHQTRPCGAGRVCGSYSVRSDQPLRSAKLRFFYDAGHDLSVDLIFTVQNHGKSPQASAYSAVAYGVFDVTNRQVLARMIDNFGLPTPDQVPQFGLTRRFRASSPTLYDATPDQVEAVRQASGSAYLFPAGFCGPSDPGSGTSEFEREGWLEPSLGTESGERGACFSWDLLDKHGSGLLGEKPMAYARKNPVIAMGDAFKLTSPLRDVTTIPVVIAVCPDDPFASALTDGDFFNYQRFVLGLDDRPIDVCFRSNDVGDFASRLRSHLENRLAQARAASGDLRDLLLVIVLHDKFTDEFQSVARSVAEEVYRLAQPENNALSPRLLGGFVYSSTTSYQPNATQRPWLLWCPQDLIAQVLSPMAPLADQNCTTTPSFELNLQVINFVTPLGPLPSLERYRTYVEQYGDGGLARRPRIRFQSVPIDALSVLERDSRVTYFSGQRYALGPGEKARVCFDKAQSLLGTMRVKRADSDTEVPGITLEEVSPLWLSEDGTGDYLLGLAWEYPFVGGISYESPLSGRVVGLVPYQRSFKAYEELGDPKWRTEAWDFGSMVQHCRAFCDHPFFDKGGVYQVQQSWSDPTLTSCPEPSVPEAPRSGGSTS